MIYLDLDLLLHVAEQALGGQPGIRDVGLLESALARPRASVFGQDAYPTLHLKAAALLHSLAKNHALVDGNKRLAFTAAAVFLWINGEVLSFSDEQGYDLMIAVANGQLDDVEDIAARLESGTTTS